ncbi:MAG: PxxKW family cysteine-rich protein [Planctomycetota bacterium]
MDCTSVRNGKECPFMTTKGCSYNGGICHEIVEQCNGCSRSVEFSSAWYCTAYPDPSLKWKVGNCNLASHVASASSTVKAKINPLKASKRRNR